MKSPARRELSVDEIRGRLRNAVGVIDLGAGALLASTDSEMTAEETDQSLIRLLKGSSGKKQGTLSA